MTRQRGEYGQNITSRTEQLGQDNRVRTTWTGQPGQEKRDRTTVAARTEQAEQDSRGRTAGQVGLVRTKKTERPEYDKTTEQGIRDRISRTGQSDYESKDRG